MENNHPIDLKVRSFETQRCELSNPVACDAVCMLRDRVKNTNNNQDLRKFAEAFTYLRGHCALFGRWYRTPSLNLPCQELHATVKAKLDQVDK